MPRADPLRNGPLCDLSVGLGAQGQAGGGGRSIIRSIILGRLPVGSGRAKVRIDLQTQLIAQSIRYWFKERPLVLDAGTTERHLGHTGCLYGPQQYGDHY